MTWHLVDLKTDTNTDIDAALAPGQKIVVRVEDRELLICRVENEYFAIGSRCTHAAWPLASEPIDGFEIICTLHGARFDIRDGCPTLGPASKRLATFPIELRNGAIYVSLPS